MPPDLAAAAAALATNPAAGFAARNATSPSGRLTLARALAQALLGSPDLAAYGFDIRSAEARTLQAGYRPNPEVNTFIEDFGGNRDRAGFRGYQGTLSPSQVIELGGKRAQRLRLARLDQSLSAWDYEARRGGRKAMFESAEGDLDRVSPPPPLPALLASYHREPGRGALAGRGAAARAAGAASIL